MGFYPEQEEKATDHSEKQAKIVAFTYIMVQLQLHEISNVHLEFQLTTYSFTSCLLYPPSIAVRKILFPGIFSSHNISIIV